MTVHRFDGLDLWTTLVGLLLLIVAAWLLWCLWRSREDTGPTGRFWGSVDLAHHHDSYAHISIYDMWEEKFVFPASPDVARTQLAYYQDAWVKTFEMAKELYSRPYNWADDPDA